MYRSGGTQLGVGRILRVLSGGHGGRNGLTEPAGAAYFVGGGSLRISPAVTLVDSCSHGFIAQMSFNVTPK
jgi:hypothetical protein